MPRVEVETEAVTSLARHVLTAAASLAEADLAQAAEWAAAALPGSAAAMALEECAVVCRRIVTLLNTNLETFSERLADAASAYQAADWLPTSRQP
jgi:Excreted virulence factor EspC, type VII ESX diderm